MESKRFIRTKKGMFVGLDIPAAVRFLSSDAPSQARSVIYAGLRAWALQPTNARAIKEAMLTTCFFHLNSRQRGKRKPPFEKKTSPYLDQFFELLGGSDAVHETVERSQYDSKSLKEYDQFDAESAKAKQESREGARNAVSYLLQLGRIIHWQVASLTREYGSPGFERAHVAAEEIGLFKTNHLAPVSDRQMWDYVALHKPSLPILYAASMVCFSNGRPILNSVLTGRGPLAAISPHFSVWFRYATHLTDEVFVKMRGGKSTFPKLDVVPLRPPVPPFSDTEARAIKSSLLPRSRL